MSGAEFIAVAAVASSLIAIIDGMHKVYEATLDAEGLPKVFRRASSKLEIISEILKATKSTLERSKALGVESTIQNTINNCQNDWNKLKELFEKVIPDEGASRMERYAKAAKNLGKGSKVETLMKDLLENVQLLTTFKIMTERGELVIGTEADKEKLNEHIAQVASWEPSLPDSAFGEGNYTMQVSGSGNHVAHGERAKQIHISENARNIKVQGNWYENVNHGSPVSVKDLDQACLRTLKWPDTFAIKNELKKTRGRLIPESMNWIFQNPQYISWKDGSEVCLLWIKGGAGKGKTMMSIGLIEELSHPHDAIVIYFFCKYTDYELNTIEAVLKGLILRLADQQKETLEVLRHHWDRDKGCFVRGTPSWQELWNILLEMLGPAYCKYPRVYAIIDALDECEEGTMGDFLKRLVRTGLDDPPRIKWLLTSRPLDSAERELLTNSDQVQVSLEINSTYFSRGITAYVAEKVAELDKKKHYGPELVKNIEIQLTQKSENTYMWVSLVCTELESVGRQEALATIQVLPKGLTPLYDRILDQLSSGDPAIVKGCMRLLKVMVLAFRPLNVDEICIVSGLDQSGGWLTVDMLLDRCASLVYRRGASGIEFVHKSARDYLTGARGQSILDRHESYGDGEILLSLLSHLSPKLGFNIDGLPYPEGGDWISHYIHRKVTKRGNLIYAATFWPRHLARTEQSVLIKTHLLELLGTFLRRKLLQWLEYVCLLDQVDNIKSALDGLEDTLIMAKLKERDEYSFIWEILHNTTLLLSEFSYALGSHPLHVYTLAMVFFPDMTVLLDQNPDMIPPWLKRLPPLEDAPMRSDPTSKPSTDPVAVFSPTGEHIASVCYSGPKPTIRIWDTKTGKTQKNLEGIESSEIITALVFSPDGKQVISGSSGGYVIMWDVATGEIRKGVTGRQHIGKVDAVAFSWDGQQIVSSSRDQSIMLWDKITGDHLNLIGEGSRHSNAIAFSPDGQQIAVGSDSFDIRVLDTRSGQIRRILGGHSAHITAIAYAPDGRYISSGSLDHTIKLWDVTKQFDMKKLVGNTLYSFFKPRRSRIRDLGIQTPELDTQVKSYGCCKFVVSLSVPDFAGLGFETEIHRNPDPRISWIRFSDDQQYLVTNIGQIRIKNMPRHFKFRVADVDSAVLLTASQRLASILLPKHQRYTLHGGCPKLEYLGVREAVFDLGARIFWEHIEILPLPLFDNSFTIASDTRGDEVVVGLPDGRVIRLGINLEGISKTFGTRKF